MAALTPLQRLQALNPAKRAAFRQYLAGATAPPPPVTPGAPTTFVLPGSAEAEFGAQQSNIGETYNEEVALNQYKLQNAQIARDREVVDQRDAITQGRTALPDAYIARGMFGRGSGVYGAGLSRFNTMAQQGLDRSSQDYTRQLAGLRLDRGGIERRRTLSLANLRMKHQAVVSDAAARSVK